MVQIAKSGNATTECKANMWSKIEKVELRPQNARQTCGPNRKKWKCDHRMQSQYVVQNRKSGIATTECKANMWSKLQKQRMRPQNIKQTCGPNRKKWNCDHRMQGKHVVQNRKSGIATTNHKHPKKINTKESNHGCFEIWI